MKKLAMAIFLAAALLSNQADGADSFRLQWQQDDPVDGFRLDRKIETGAYAEILDIPNGNLREIEDASVQHGNTYCYRLWSYRNNLPGEAEPIVKSLNSSNEACDILSGVDIDIPANKRLLISRRATNTSSIVSLLVNKDEPVTQTPSGLPDAPTGVVINVRSGITLQTSRRSLNTSSTISILVNKDEVVRVNKLIIQ